MAPFLPFSAETCAAMLRVDGFPWDGASEELAAGHALGEPKILFEKLDAAEAHYRPALALGDPPASANIEAKVHFGLGQVNVGRLSHAVAAGGDWQTPLAEARALHLLGALGDDPGALLEAARVLDRVPPGPEAWRVRLALTGLAEAQGSVVTARLPSGEKAAATSSEYSPSL